MALIELAQALLPKQQAKSGGLLRRLLDGLSQGHLALPSDVATEAGTSESQWIVNEHGHYALKRFALLEQQLALAILRLDREAPMESIAAVKLVFESGLPEPNLEQAEAVDLVTRRGLALLSGGPGTGKTFTLAQMVNRLRRLQPGIRVFGCAPTGKAAQRMLQSGVQLDQAMTVHRLVDRLKRRSALGPKPPALPFDVLVIDEATMLDAERALALFVNLQDDLPRVIMAGDRDQLSSVQSGAVFAQLCELTHALAVLKKPMRFSGQSSIAQWAQWVREGAQGEGQPSIDDLKTEATGGVRFCPREDWLSELDALYEPINDALDVFVRTSTSQFNHDHLAENQLILVNLMQSVKALCATRLGPLGTIASNRFLEQIRRRRNQHLQREGFRGLDQSALSFGQIVLVTRNDSQTGLRNGDVGIVLWKSIDTKQGLLQVAFSNAEGIQLFSPNHLPLTEYGWAMTVHKSQGSEFAKVLFALAPKDSVQARRELVYTAMTRAKEQLTLFGELSDLEIAAQTPSERFSTLGSRLRYLRATSSTSL